jgi:hypothetical protein
MSTITTSGTLYNNGFQATGTTSRVAKTYPIQLIGTITVTFGENLNFSNANNYFTIQNTADNVTIDGANYTVTINGVTAGYGGLIQSKSNNSKVKNIGVLSTNGSKLSQGSGWLGRADTFGAVGFLGTVTTCYSDGAIGNTGDVNTACGGLIGSLAGSGGTCTISNSYSTGDVLNNSCGGIVGDSSGYKFESGVGYCEVNSCYSTGNITGINSGGIAGANAGISGECKVINCYSIGIINGIDAGGIVGSKAGSTSTFVPGKCDIVNCFSTGVISTTSSGGISGSYAGDGGYCKIDGCFSRGNISGAYSGGICGEIGGSLIYTGTCIINNCYSTGIISGIGFTEDPSLTRAGGILGPNNKGGGTITITNCYVSGNITNGLDTGGIVGGSSNATVTNCRYNNGWTDITASSTSGGVTTGILNPVSGSVWKKIVNTDNPWKLNSFLIGNTAVYNALDKSLTYTSVFPINTYKGLVTPIVIFMLQGIGFSGAFPGDNSTKSLTYNNFPDPVADNTQMTILLTSNNSLYDSLDVLLVSVISVTTTTTTTTTTTSTTTTTTTVQPNVILVTQAYVDSTTFPVTISGAGKNVLLMENIITTKNIQFIFPAGSSVKFDGQGNTITLSGVKNYTGLINSASNNTIVQNLGILTSNNSTLANLAGWIGCSYYAGTVTNCYSTGDIGGDGSGGIVGSYRVDTYSIYLDIISLFSNNTISTSISNCYSTGSISGNGSGGIVGSYAGCGVMMERAYYYKFKCDISNCYSTGDINGSNSGGITGYRTSYNYFDFLYIFLVVNTDDSDNKNFYSISYCTISNCYSSGAISGPDSGGIVGSEAFSYLFGGDSGRWVASFNYYIGRTLLITNCYTSGNIFGSNSGGILGARAGRGIPNSGITSYSPVRDEGSDQSYETTTYAYLNINITKCYVIGNNVNGSNYIYGSNSLPVADLTNGLIVQVIRTSNNTYTAGWVDRSANDVLDANIYFKVSPSPIRDVPYKLLIFLYTSNASLNGTTLTYSNIWPIIGFNSSSTYLTDNGGNRVSTGTATLDTTGKILTIPSVSITSTQSSYSLVVSGQYFDRFTLVGNYIVRLRFTADYLQVIVSPETYASFKTSLQQAIATALRVTLENVVVLNLSPGSILAEIYVPPDLIGQLQSIVESGNLNVEFNGTTYQADPNYFVVIDNICFHRDTLILTPNGYRKVQSLQRGDLVKTAQGREVPIKRITSFTGSREKCPLHVMYKDTIAPNVPIQDLYMSEGHAFYNNGKWRHMKCSDLTTKLDVDNIEYYNIVLDNYMENTLIANGLEVESLFEMEGLKMRWRCEKSCCTPVIERAK